MKKYSSFKKKVLAIVKKIPKGSVLTYKQVATKAGNPKASRAVGAILKTNYDEAIPCHRVIHSDGRPGKYNRGSRKKLLLLKREGFMSFTQDTNTPLIDSR